MIKGNNIIEENCHIDDNVKMGSGNKILRGTIIYGPCKLGDNNIIGPNAIIGSLAQHTHDPRHDASNKKVIIGSNNIIREFTSIQKSYSRDATVIGDHVYIMDKVTVNHDDIIKDHVILSPGSILAGTVTIFEAANIGINTSVHQESVIGHFSMIAMNSAVVKNIKPFSKYIHGKPLMINTYSIKKYQMDEHLHEIANYVVHDIPPTTEIIKYYINQFNKAHKASGRSIYKGPSL